MIKFTYKSERDNGRISETSFEVSQDTLEKFIEFLKRPEIGRVVANKLTDIAVEMLKPRTTFGRTDLMGMMAATRPPPPPPEVQFELMKVIMEQYGPRIKEKIDEAMNEDKMKTKDIFKDDTAKPSHKKTVPVEDPKKEEKEKK